MAEALFGSAARGDADSLSDKDIIIVDENVSTLRERASELESEGWSVASYTFRKLEALANSGALFVQHLKMEARIVVDEGRRLAEILDAFQPKLDYSLEIAANAKLAQLVGTMPSIPNGGLLASDILFVAVRNFGILTLAERGIHKYSYSQILDYLEDIGAINGGGASVLAELRRLKNLYRAGIDDLGDNSLQVVNRALSYLPTGPFPKRVFLCTPIALVCAGAPLLPASPYLLLRDLEKRYFSMRGIVPVQELGGDIEVLTGWINNPRAYALISSKAAPLLREVMMERVLSRAALLRSSAA